MSLCLASSLLLSLSAASAFAETTQKLIVTLDAPHESAPEMFCVIGEQRCTGPQCSGLADIKDALRFDGTRVTFDATRLQTPPDHEPLRDALRALSMQGTSSRRQGQACHACTPEVTRVEYMGTAEAPHGYITCAKNRRTTASDRVAVTFLRFHKDNVPSPVSSIELLGDHATIHFSKPVDVDDYEFLLSIGGDYLANTVGLGTKERMVLPLHPRCTSSTIVLPPRARVATPELLSVALDREPVDGCVETSTESIAVWLPYRPTEDVKMLRLAYAGASSSLVYEASWAERSPPNPLRARHRQLELSWRKDCLVGTLPAGSASDWSASCPRVTLPAAGATCDLLDSPSHCRYRCTAPLGMPAFELPTPVRFDRYGQWPGEPEPRKAYSWDDTLGYAGQELTSFLAPLDRQIVVELPTPDAWRSRRGNEIDHVEIRSGSGIKRILPIRRDPPRWATLSVPNAVCSERFTVTVVGAQTFERADQGLSEEGNLVLDRPDTYRDLFHWVVVLGGGALLPRNQKMYRTERDAEAHASIGAGFELYLDRPFPGAFEVTALYELTRTAYGVVRLPEDRGDRLGLVPYHRGSLELGLTRWGRNRASQLGLTGGGGLGGPLAEDQEKVGTLRSFLFVGALGRIRPSSWNVWIELNAGVRWGEKHQYFGTGEDGHLISNTFHGEPHRTERRLWQLYGGLRLRGTIL